MKQYIVMGDSNGLFVDIEGKFDSLQDATDFARLARISNDHRNFTVYQKVEEQA